MKRILVLSLALFAANLFAGEKEVLAGEMLTLVGTPKMVKQYQGRMKMMLAGALKRLKTTPAAKAKAAEVSKNGNELIVKSFNWDSVKNELIKKYAAAFSVEELKGIVAFYKSPVGKKLLEKSPALMRSSMQVVQKKCMDLLPQIKKMVDEVKVTATSAKTACVGGKCSTSKCGVNCKPATSKCPTGVCPAKK